MKFQAKVNRNFNIRIPANVAQVLGIKPGDLVEISIEHIKATLIANSPKFTDFMKELGVQRLQELQLEFLEAGGRKKHGSLKVWIVKKLKLDETDLSEWYTKEELEKMYPKGKIQPPVIKRVRKPRKDKK
jgi:AbrB family looped-hinge helix DNA binding protein